MEESVCFYWAGIAPAEPCGRWCLHLREAILCLLMVLHLASEQWVMIERKKLDLLRGGEDRKSDDDNDDDKEEEDRQPHC